MVYFGHGLNFETDKIFEIANYRLRIVQINENVVGFITEGAAALVKRHQNLVAIDAGLFREGMYIEPCIYYLYQDTYVLLCKNVLLTKELINKLQQVALTQNGIYLDEAHFEEVWNESLRHRHHTQESAEPEDARHQWDEKSQASQEAYTKTVCETAQLLVEVAQSNQISLQMAQDISKNIFNELKHIDDSLILNCINDIRQTDDYLYTHCVNVASLNGLISKWLQLSDADTSALIRIGLMHDLGKLKVSPRILNKPGKLTDAEFEEMKLHPIYSCDILKNSGEVDQKILHGIRGHHEKINGCGYPDHLSLDDISLFSRITSVSDIYDAMVSKRCYKKPQTPFEVLALFAENQFSDLDMHIVKIFLQNVPYLLIGNTVQLSTDEEGQVIYVSPNNYANPIIKAGDRIIATDSSCKCISMQSKILKH